MYLPNVLNINITFIYKKKIFAAIIQSVFGMFSKLKRYSFWVQNVSTLLKYMVAQRVFQVLYLEYFLKVSVTF